MKDKVLIQVWGKANSGKTRTIKIIRNELEKKFINVNHTYSFPLPKGEIFDIFKCNGYVIGISSMGDDLTTDLKNHLNTCFAKCSIIIAASRIYNNVEKYLEKESFSNSFKRIKVTNYRIKGTKPEQFEFNKASAIHIVDLIDQTMSGRI